MKPASLGIEAYIIFSIYFMEKYSPRTYEMSIKNIVILRILCCLLFLLP